jgi:hypothetical protein
MVGIIINISAGGGDDRTPKSTDISKKTEKNTELPVAKEGVLTKEKFDKIKEGMTYEEVVKIVGAKGTVLSESGEKDTEFHNMVYEFKAKGDVGANANMIFQGGKLINKAQFGLGGGDLDVTIIKTEFEEIQNGMTYEEVQKIIGGEGEINSESGEKGTDLHTIIITYHGKDGLGANANFMFSGNKLQNKAQFGLE